MIYKFRLALLDDYDQFVSSEWESDFIEAKDKWDKHINDLMFDHLLRDNGKYSFVDYDNVPPMEYQYRVGKNKDNMSEWKFWSDPIEDYFNL